MGVLMMVTGRPGEGPMRAGVAVADMAAGLYAALGAVRLLAQAAPLARTPATLAAPALECGEHTEEVLRELGYDAAQGEELRRGQVI